MWLERLADLLTDPTVLTVTLSALMLGLTSGALGTFAVMGVWGVFVLAIGTMIAGAFGVETSGMQSLIAGLGLLAFSGVTAWQTQSTKEMYHASYGDDANSRMAWSAALTLYISFIAIFQYILHFVGNRE